MWVLEKDRFNYHGLELLIIRNQSKDKEVDLLLLNGNMQELFKLLLRFDDVKIYPNRRPSTHLKFVFLRDPKRIEYDVVSELRYGLKGSGIYKLRHKYMIETDMIGIGKVLHNLLDKKKIEVNDKTLLECKSLKSVWKSLPLALRLIYNFKRNEFRLGYVAILRVFSGWRIQSLVYSFCRKFFRDHRSLIFMGVDGSGKSTLAKALVAHSPDVEYLYNGRYGGFSRLGKYLSKKKIKRVKHSEAMDSIEQDILDWKLLITIKSKIIQSVLNFVRIYDSTVGFHFYRFINRRKGKYLLLDRSIYESPVLSRNVPIFFSVRPQVIVHVKANIKTLLTRKQEHSGLDLENMMNHHIESLQVKRWISIISISSDQSTDNTLNYLSKELITYDPIWKK